MEPETFTRWLGDYGRAWETRDPDAAAELFVPDATYQWGPHELPLQGREQIRARWAQATGSQRDVLFGFEPLAVTKERGIARWWVSFTRDDRRVRLEGIFDISLTSDDLCTSLREWWNGEDEPLASMSEPPSPIQALGEVALRVKACDLRRSH